MTSPEAAADPERGLILAYAAAEARVALAAMLALDDALAQVLRTTSEPMIGQMRLTWWHEQLTKLDDRAPPAEPVLRALAEAGVPGATLAQMVEGWEELLEPEVDVGALERFAAKRGGLFAAAGRVLGAGPGDPLAVAGQGWALADLSRHLSDPAAEARAREMAVPLLATACGARWSRSGRALGAMAHLARMDLAKGRVPGAPGRVARVLWHRLTGR